MCSRVRPIGGSSVSTDRVTTLVYLDSSHQHILETSFSIQADIGMRLYMRMTCGPRRQPERSTQSRLPRGAAACASRWRTWIRGCDSESWKLADHTIVVMSLTGFHCGMVGPMPNSQAKDRYQEVDADNLGFASLAPQAAEQTGPTDFPCQVGVWQTL